MIDKETELMPTSGHEGMLIYNYRLVSYSVKIWTGNDLPRARATDSFKTHAVRRRPAKIF
jgi:hypothetical protein